MPIRQHRPPTDEFVEEFQETIVPSATPSSEFIDWNGIEDEIKNYEVQIEAILDLEDASEEQFVEGLSDALTFQYVLNGDSFCTFKQLA